MRLASVSGGGGGVCSIPERLSVGSLRQRGRRSASTAHYHRPSTHVACHHRHLCESDTTTRRKNKQPTCTAHTHTIRTHGTIHSKAVIDIRLRLGVQQP